MLTFQFTASNGLLNILLKYAESIGLEKEEIFSHCNSDFKLINNSTRISMPELERIWTLIKHKSDDINIGLHFGEFCGNFLNRHIIFTMMSNCRNLKQAIEKNFLYHNLVIDLITPKLLLKDEFALLTWILNYPHEKTGRHFSEAVMAILSCMLQELSENRINIQEVRFSHSNPEDTKEHKRIFNAPLVFSSPQNEILFDKTYLEAPLFLSNIEILNDLERLVQKQIHLSYSFNSYTEKVYGFLAKRILSNEIADIESISDELSMVTRTLQIKLAKEGTSFSKIFDDVRKQISLSALGNINTTISDIALMLNFSDQSAFHNAFKRWTGMTPGKYRKSLET